MSGPDSSVKSSSSAASAQQQQEVAIRTQPFCPLPNNNKQSEKGEEIDWIFHDPTVSSTDSPSAVTKVGHFRGRHLISIEQLSWAEIERLMRVADAMVQIVDGPGMTNLAKGCILATVFYEPSTRTASSFECAMLRLGGRVLSVGDVANSSVAKGETLEDTMRCLQCYTNVIVLRHPETGSAARASSVLKVPFINAGDGVGEHPTQALLDLFTIREEFSRVQGLTVTMVGDLKNGRTVHSLCRLLVHYQVKINLVSPSSLKMPEYIMKLLKQNNIQVQEFDNLKSVLRETDVLYVTRVQKERFATVGDYESVKDAFIITPELLDENGAKQSIRILHPLPRVNELSTKLDDDPRAAYFRQMKHGLHMRMALIACLLGVA